MEWINALKVAAQRIATLTPNYRMSFVSFAALLLVLINTTACAGSKTVKWKEEVALHDGSTLIVSRVIAYGGGAREPGAKNVGGTQGDILDFTAPDGREIHWENPGYLGPMILDFLDGVPYLVTRPILLNDFTVYKCPNPAYVFFKYLNDWQRIEYSDFPKQFQDRNLSGDVSDPARNGYVSAEDVKKMMGKYSLVPTHMRKIDPASHSPTPPCPLPEGAGWRRVEGGIDPKGSTGESK